MNYQESPISPFALKVLKEMGHDPYDSPTMAYDHMSDDLNMLDIEQDIVAEIANDILGDHRDYWENPEVRAAVQIQQCWPLLKMSGPVGYTWHDKIGALYEGLDYLRRDTGGYR
jgi:hypothetical protein